MQDILSSIGLAVKEFMEGFLNTIQKSVPHLEVFSVRLNWGGEASVMTLPKILFHIDAPQAQGSMALLVSLQHHDTCVFSTHMP